MVAGIGSKRKILIINEETSVCDYLRDLLTYFGYAVDCARSCQGSINLLQLNQYNAVIMDTWLEDGSSEKVARWLKAQNRSDRIILISDPMEYSMWFDVLGSKTTVRKPIKPSELQRALHCVAA